jgi:hypothetical protein
MHKSEMTMRSEWARIAAARPKEYRDQPVAEGFIAKQTPMGTCIPHAERTR